jgi:hypothetical protein
MGAGGHARRFVHRQRERRSEHPVHDRRHPNPGLDSGDVNLNILSATPVAPASANDTTPVRSIALTGTVTVTIGLSDAVTLPFTGTLSLTGTTSGRLQISTTRDTGGVTMASGFSLNGTLTDNSISVARLVVSDHTDPPAGYVFLSTSSQTAPPSRPRPRVSATRSRLGAAVKHGLTCDSLLLSVESPKVEKSKSRRQQRLGSGRYDFRLIE